MYAAILSVILSLPACYGEPNDVPRLGGIALAIDTVATTPDDAAALISIGFHESGFCRRVQSGAKRGGLGEGLWQIEPGAQRQRPFSGLDQESTTHAAGEALWLWSHTSHCGDMAKRFGAYAGLGCRSWSGAAPRVRLWWYVRARLLAFGHGSRSTPAPPSIP